MGKRQGLRALSFESSGGVPARDPLADLVEEFLTGYEYGGSPKTHLLYRTSLKVHLMPFLEGQGVLVLGDVGPAVLSRYLAHEARRLAPVSVRKAYDVAHRFLQWCVEQEFLDANPCDRVRAPRIPDAARHAFDREELRRMRIVMDAKPGVIGQRDRAIFAILVGTGARASELLGMEMKDIDWPHHRLLLHGKGGRDRRVPLGEKASRALRMWLRARYAVPSQRVWLTLRRTVMDYSALSKMLENLAEYADVDNITPHRFRHTFAVEHYRAHRDVMALKSLLGHSKLDTTTIYLRTLGVDYGVTAQLRSPDEWLT